MGIRLNKKRKDLLEHRIQCLCNVTELAAVRFVAHEMGKVPDSVATRQLVREALRARGLLEPGEPIVMLPRIRRTDGTYS